MCQPQNPPQPHLLARNGSWCVTVQSSHRTLMMYILPLQFMAFSSCLSAVSQPCMPSAQRSPVLDVLQGLVLRNLSFLSCSSLQRQSSEEPSDLYSPSPVGPTTSNRSKSTGGTTLYEMIEAGVLQPGIDNATVTYKGSTYAGSLQANGTIFFRGKTPNACSS